MAIEKFWTGVSSQLFTADGGTRGQITLTSTTGFKVKMNVLITSGTQETLTLEVKRVLSGTLLEVGDTNKPISSRRDITAFLTADGAAITANLQPRQEIPLKDIGRAVYEEEPTVAIRMVQVDQFGNIIGGTGGSSENVNLRDGFGVPITSTTDGGQQCLDVDICTSLPTGDNEIGRVKLTDGVTVVGVTPEGELKVQADINPEDLPNFTAYGEMEVANLKPVISVHFNYNNHPDLIDTTLVGSGTVTNASGLAEIRSGAATSSSARLFTKDAVEFAPGMGASLRFIAFFDTAVVGNNQKIGAGDNTDGLFIGFSGTTFGIFLIAGGVPIFTPQASFSEDILNGTGPSGFTLVPTAGNIYQIQTTGSGMGHTILSIMDTVTRRWIPFHILNVLNVATSLTSGTVIFPISAFSENSTNATDVVVRLGSLSGLIEGRGEFSTIRRSVAVLRTGITTEVAVVTIRNKTIFAGKTNLIRVQLDYISTANDGNKPVTYRLIRDTTLGGVPVFADIDTAGSVIEFDTAGTTVTGGTEILDWEEAKGGSDKFVISTLFIVLRPGEQYTVTAASTTATEVNIALGWRELF